MFNMTNLNGSNFSFSLFPSIDYWRSYADRYFNWFSQQLLIETNFSFASIRLMICRIWGLLILSYWICISLTTSHSIILVLTSIRRCRSQLTVNLCIDRQFNLYIPMENKGQRNNSLAVLFLSYFRWKSEPPMFDQIIELIERRDSSHFNRH